MSSATRPARRGAPALLIAAGLLLAGCSGEADADAADSSGSSGGHDHAADPPATLAEDDGGYEGLHLADPYQKPDFTLTDTTGAAFDFAEQTADGPTLLFFGYTHCPDICPATMADVALALRTVDPAVAQQTNVVFVTTDPARDTTQVLGEYLDLFDADLAAPFVGLTGDQAAIDQAQLAAGVPQAEDNGQLHSSLLLLYGTDGEADVAFDAENNFDDIAHDLAVVAAE